MYVIALTLVFLGQTQMAPKYKPYELQPGDETYFITNRDGSAFDNGRESRYVRRKSADKLPATDTVRYYYDDFDKTSTSPWEFKISEIREELESDYNDQSRRRKRLEEQAAAWHLANGNVLIEFADRSTGWMEQEKVALSRRAREAAATVMEDRAVLESGIPESLAIAVPEPGEGKSPGFVELWGPQAAVGFLGLVLMGAAARLLIFRGDGGWERIE